MLSEVSSANGTTVYTYDVNGSLTNKANEGKFSYQYGYDLRNRLATASITRKEGTADVTITSSYAYNTDGIRTRALQTINGNTQNRYFLLDDGHTGYAQVFEETAELGGSIVRSYTIGDDVLSQTVTGVTSHLLYDGHGSTRQLADNNGAVTANYAYDAYGKMLGGNPGVTDGKTSATDLLYAGEQFDPGLQMEYLRARYYDQDNGQFNRLDPFEGNSEDPQSLHKYAYCHADPVNGIDPSGEFTLIGILLTMSITIIAISLSAPIWTRLHVFYATYNSTPMTEQDLRRAKAAMDFWWPHETKMQNLSKKIKQILDSGVDNSCPIRVFSTPFASGSRIITNNMYVEEDILQENSAGLALVIFGEYQHTAEGGGLGERAAQDELIPLKRRLIGTPVWTPFIMALHHGGTDPW